MRRTPTVHVVAAATLGAVAVALTGCMTTEQLAPPVDTAMIELGALEGSSSDVLLRGRRLYLTKCTHCHSPERIADYSKGRWTSILRTMSDRAALSDQQRDDVRAYVLAARVRADSLASAPVD